MVAVIGRRKTKPKVSPDMVTPIRAFDCLGYWQEIEPYAMRIRGCCGLDHWAVTDTDLERVAAAHAAAHEQVAS